MKVGNIHVLSWNGFQDHAENAKPGVLEYLKKIAKIDGDRVELTQEQFDDLQNNWRKEIAHSVPSFHAQITQALCAAEVKAERERICRACEHFTLKLNTTTNIVDRPCCKLMPSCHGNLDVGWKWKNYECALPSGQKKWTSVVL